MKKKDLTSFTLSCGQQPLKRRENRDIPIYGADGTLGWDGATIPIVGVVFPQFPILNPVILANTWFLTPCPSLCQHLGLLTALAEGDAGPTPGESRTQLQNQQVLANPSPSTVYPSHEHAAAL